MHKPVMSNLYARKLDCRLQLASPDQWENKINTLIVTNSFSSLYLCDLELDAADLFKI